MKPPGNNLNVLADDPSAVPTPDPLPPSGAARQPPMFGLDVVSDVICPWCWVGKRRLEKALMLLGGGPAARVTWRPYQLNPTMPKEGVDRRAYRTRKFGSWEYSQQLDARLVAAGRAEDLNFNFDKIARTPNTLDAHRLIRLAGRVGVQDAVVEALFRAYFTDGADVGRRDSLVAVAASAGLPAADAERLLESDEDVAEVLADEEKGKAMGIEGVPAFVVGGTVAVSGAAEPRVMAEAFQRASGDRTPQP